jgi:hypothetical protein
MEKQNNRSLVYKYKMQKSEQIHSHVNSKAPDLGYAPRFLAFFMAWAESRFESGFTLRPLAANAHR